MPLKKISPGPMTDFPAGTWNTIVDVVSALQRERARGSTDTERDLPRASGIIQVKNASGGDLPAFGILGIDAPVYTPTDSVNMFALKTALRGITPTSSHVSKFVVAMGPIGSNAAGDCVLSGFAICKIDVTDASHTRADVKASDNTKLASGSVGAAQIVWRETGTGTKWAIIRLGGEVPLNRLVKTTVTHSPGSTQNVNVWKGSVGSETVSTGPIVLSATNRTSLTIASGKFCLAIPVNLADSGAAPDIKWYIEPLEC